jgi:zinc protease
MAVTGDFDPKQTLAWIQKYFGDIPKATLPPPPDISEPRQEKEKRATKEDKLATRPALAFSYHMPQRDTPEYYAMGVLEEILVEGKDSALYQALVQKTGLTGAVNGGINELGNMFNIKGPVLFTVSLFHDKDKSPEQIMKVVDEEIEKLRTAPVDKETLARAMVKLRSELYDAIDGLFGFGKADLLCAYALFDDDPEKINRIEGEFRKVTPELILKTAKEYLRPTNRTVLLVEAKGEAKPEGKAAEKSGN